MSVRLFDPLTVMKEGMSKLDSFSNKKDFICDVHYPSRKKGVALRESREGIDRD